MDKIQELRQLQTALKNTEGISSCRKAPNQLGLFVEFRGYQYRVDYVAESWQTKIGFVEGPDLAELQALVPVILRVQQEKEAEAIAAAEAKKVEEEKAKADAIAKAAAEKAEEEELRKKCLDFHVGGWNRQEWCKQRFGKFAISDLILAELRILWEKIQTLNRRVITPTPGEEVAIANPHWGYINEKTGIWKFKIRPNSEIVDFSVQQFEEDGGRLMLKFSVDFSGFPEPQRESKGMLWQANVDENSGISPGNISITFQGIEGRTTPEEVVEHFGRRRPNPAIALKGKALTLRQPWAWAVFNCGKNIENRAWETSYRGRIFIHAGCTYDHEGAAWIWQKFGIEAPEPDDLPSGAIVGSVEIGSISKESFKPNLFPWAIEGQYHWHLKKPISYPDPIPCKGRLGLFDVDILYPTPSQWILDNAEEFWARSREIPNGSPYRPSNGSEGDWFCGRWCEQCSKLNSCPLPIRSMGGDQPAEWVYWDRKPICLAWDEAIADKPLAYYPYQGNYKVGDAEGNLVEFESAEEAIEFINNWNSTVVNAAEAKTGKSLAFYQIAEEVDQ